MNTIRHATYDLLAQLFLAPPTAEVLQRLATLPPFDSALQGVTLDSEGVEAFQVAYQELFGFNFFPYESLFHDHDLMVNSASAALVARLMEQGGFDGTLYSVGAVDHIGVQLAFMAYLIQQENTAISRQNQGMAHRAHELQATVLHHHLATWAPVAMLTIQSIAPVPLLRLLAEVTLELILSDLTHIPATDAQLRVMEHSPSTMPMEEENEEDDGLSRQVRALITPVESGLFLTRTNIRAIARQLQLPTTMGDRFTMLKQLFEAAGQFEQIGALLTALEHFWQEKNHEIDALIMAAPAWRPYGNLWQQRLAEGQSRLAQLRDSWKAETSP